MGDIHGRLDRLLRLMDRLPFDPEKNRIVFLGDYINRGPDSRGVLDFLIDLEKTCPGAVFLLGNHERVLLEYAQSGDPEQLRLLRVMGVESTLAAYGDYLPHAIRNLAFMPPEHRAFLERLRLYWACGEYLFVHGGLPPGKRPEECSREELTETREFLSSPARSGGPVIVFGHTVFETPLLMPGKIGLDTGAGHGSMLTAVELPALRFYHA